MTPAQTAHFSVDNPPTAEQLGSAKRIEVRPRQPGGRAESAANAQGDTASTGQLHFTCPSCLQMMSAPRSPSAVPIACGSCGSSVLPPQIVSQTVATQGKTSLPPPRKTGTAAVRHG